MLAIAIARLHSQNHSQNHYHSQKEQILRHVCRRARTKGFDFESFKAAYPKRSGSQPWARAVKAANARIKEGATFDAMIDGARRYAEFCDSCGQDRNRVRDASGDVPWTRATLPRTVGSAAGQIRGA